MNDRIVYRGPARRHARRRLHRGVKVGVIRNELLELIFVVCRTKMLLSVHGLLDLCLFFRFFFGSFLFVAKIKLVSTRLRCILYRFPDAPFFLILFSPPPPPKSRQLLNGALLGPLGMLPLNPNQIIVRIRTWGFIYIKK